MQQMPVKKFPFPLLILGIIFFVLTLYSIFRFPPAQTIALINVPIPIFPFVLLSFTLFLFCIIGFLTRSLTHGALLSGCTLVYLLLRLAGLTSLFFLILVMALCITLELFFLNKNNP